MQMTAAKDEMHDDDDATLGTSDGPVYGMTAPDLTDADKAYLDAAANNDEYFKRMIEIARRIDVERRMSPDFKRVSTDDYFATLSKKKE